jgi:hypothetical protein
MTGANCTLNNNEKGRWGMFPEGVTSASLIIVILVAAAVGAGVGGLLEGVVTNMVWLAIIAGFVATIVAGIVRNELIHHISGAGPDTFKVPGVVITFAVIASLAGSLSAHEIIDDYPSYYNGIWTGTLAGIFSSVLMAMLMITFYLHPRRQS